MSARCLQDVVPSVQLATPGVGGMCKWLQLKFCSHATVDSVVGNLCLSPPTVRIVKKSHFLESVVTPGYLFGCDVPMIDDYSDNKRVGPEVEVHPDRN
jgi:hypothetical protein